MKSQFITGLYDFENRRLRFSGSLILLIFFLSVPQGCRFYYHVVNEKKITAEQLMKYWTEGRYFIVHSPYLVHGIEITNFNGDTISGKKSAAPYLYNGESHSINRDVRYRRPEEKGIVKEVHLYTSSSRFKDETNVKLLISQINRVEVIENSSGRNVVSWLWPPVITGAIVLIVASSSCPYVYTYDGKSYALKGEMYGGATYPSLERDDYLPLAGLKPVNDNYRLKISNELNEQQNTNLAELFLVRHPENSSVLIDKYGQIQTLSAIQKPLSAITSNKLDFTNYVTEKDSNLFLFNECNTSTSLNSLIITFKNPNNSKNGKLVISGKNSLWADYAYGKFTELFGTYYTKWNDKQKQTSAKKQIERILNQDIPLSVYLETESGWEFIDFFNVVGPLSARDMVMPINLSKADKGDVRIKLESGFMFWELDYAGMDFSENTPYELTVLKPESVVDNTGNNVTSLLYNNDKNYLTQMNIGNEAEVSYKIPEKIAPNDKNKEQTIFLHSRGFYETIRKYETKPDWGYLYSLRKPHSFTKFSVQEYERFFITNIMTSTK